MILAQRRQVEYRKNKEGAGRGHGITMEAMYAMDQPYIETGPPRNTRQY